MGQAIACLTFGWARTVFGPKESDSAPLLMVDFLECLGCGEIIDLEELVAVRRGGEPSFCPICGATEVPAGRIYSLVGKEPYGELRVKESRERFGVMDLPVKVFNPKTGKIVEIKDDG